MRSRTGKFLTDDKGEIFKYTKGEAVIKGLGFTPTRESLAWEKKAKEWDKQSEKSEKSKIYRNRIKEAYLQGNYDKAKRIADEAKEKGIISENSEGNLISDFLKEQYNYVLKPNML